MLWCKLKTLTVLTWDLAGFIFFYKDKIKIFAHHHLWLFHLDALEGIKINEKFLFPKQHFQEKNKNLNKFNCFSSLLIIHWRCFSFSLKWNLLKISPLWPLLVENHWWSGYLKHISDDEMKPYLWETFQGTMRFQRSNRNL